MRRPRGAPASRIEHRARVRGSIGRNARDLERPPVVVPARDGPANDRDATDGARLVSNRNAELVPD
jgi:hypothetical protein